MTFVIACRREIRSRLQLTSLCGQKTIWIAFVDGGCLIGTFSTMDPRTCRTPDEVLSEVNHQLGEVPGLTSEFLEVLSSVGVLR